MIFAVGVMVPAALAAAATLAEEGLDIAVVDPVVVKPLDRDLLIGEAVRTGMVITAEENALQGGFGSAVLELFSEAGVNVPVRRIGLPDKFVEQGSQEELRARYGLDAKSIVATVREVINRKSSAN